MAIDWLHLMATAIWIGGLVGLAATVPLIARQTEAEFISNWMSMLSEARDAVVATLAGRPQGEIRTELEREGIKVCPVGGGV